jgi:hypothetical protein
MCLLGLCLEIVILSGLSLFELSVLAKKPRLSFQVAILSRFITFDWNMSCVGKIIGAAAYSQATPLAFHAFLQLIVLAELL